MANVKHLLLVAFLATLLGSAAAASSAAKCVACTIISALVLEQQYMDADDMATALPAPSAVCGVLPGRLRAGCKAFLSSPAALQLLAGSPLSPDEFCAQHKMCDGQCKLFQSWPVKPPAAVTALTPPTPAAGDDAFGDDSSSDGTLAGAAQLASLAGSIAKDALKEQLSALSLGGASSSSSSSSSAAADEAAASAEEAGGFYDMVTSMTTKLNPCGNSMKCNENRVFSKHLALVDEDNDYFAGSGLTSGTFRGANWRGRDCDDHNEAIYPGRKEPVRGEDGAVNYGVDHNCNGIHGVDEAGVPYEEKLCGETPPRGLAILGDSATAHFHIPPEYMTARGWSLHKLSGVLPNVEDEMDFPDCSWSTGFMNSDQCPPSPIPMGSVYQRMLARNRCMHRDFANLGVNGARTTSMAPPNGIIEGFQRKQQLDAPVTVFYALIGNDVCNGHHNTAQHWTPPATFKAKVLDALVYLDSKLPAGSNVVFLGLVDGRVLWDTMHTLQHPIGVQYPELYDYLNCMNLNPCFGWLNSNSTWRDRTSAHAALLNEQYTAIMAENATSFSNFKMTFLNPDWNELIADYVQRGGTARDLIEPVDGFHPSQAGNQMLAKWIFETLEKEAPEALGEVNPHNDEIQRLFGDQGGY